MGADEEVRHGHLQPATYPAVMRAREGDQERAETLLLQEVLLPEVRGDVNRYYPCPKSEHSPPPRAGDVAEEIREVGPPPLITLTSNREYFQNADANLEANPNLGQHGLVQSMAQLMQAQIKTC